GGYTDIAQLLIQHKAAGNLANNDGKTALDLALGKGHLDVVQLLNEHMASDVLDNSTVIAGTGAPEIEMETAKLKSRKRKAAVQLVPDILEDDTEAATHNSVRKHRKVEM
ncbi:hypothetical protein B0H11DRAFT_2367230, partial [Mycena galericulata]